MEPRPEAAVCLFGQKAAFSSICRQTLRRRILMLAISRGIPNWKRHIHLARHDKFPILSPSEALVSYQ